MTTPISGVNLDQPADLYAPAQAATQQAPQPRPTGDRIVLSQAAQVAELNEQGQSAKEIAEALSIPLASVNSDLGIISAAAASTAATTATAATSVKSTSPAVAS